MDPISITGLALAAFQALSKTYDFVSTFVKSSRETDQSVATLQEHIFGLCQVLNAVSTVIVHPALEDPLSYNADLQNLIGTSVKDCGSIADDLSAKLNELKLPSKRAYNQVWNQIKLRIRQDDIDSLLSRIKTHSINLQLAIGTINVYVHLPG